MLDARSPRRRRHRASRRGDQAASVIFHLAAHGAYSWQTDFDDMIAINVARHGGAARRRARRRSAGVRQRRLLLGVRLKDHAPRENERLRAQQPLRGHEGRGQRTCAGSPRREGLPAVTLRLYSIYGPWEDPGRLMPTLVREATRRRLPAAGRPANGTRLRLGRGLLRRVLRAAQRAPGGPGAVLNLGTGAQTRLDELVEIARRVLGVDAQPEWGTMDQREWDTDVWVSDPRAARSISDGRRPPPRRGPHPDRDWLQAKPQLWGRYGVET